MKRVLITGGAGFIGSNLARYLLEVHAERNEEIQVTVFDSLTYAGSLENLKFADPSNSCVFVKADVRDLDQVKRYVSESDEIYHLAAESHVDRSIVNPNLFVETNVIGTSNLLLATTEFKVKMVLVSTDEVYGSILSGSADENAPLNPSSPYSASKASADLLALAFHNTYGTNVVITRCANNFGLNQFPEKLIPLAIRNISKGLPIPVYGNGQNVREWIHVRDHCSGLLLVMEKGKSGEIYNFGSGNELKNIDLIDAILKFMGKGNEYIEFVDDRLGHDQRYSLNSSKVKSILNWTPTLRLEDCLEELIQTYSV
jgi:dTDP-glucose 4,6-dehydratase